MYFNTYILVLFYIILCASYTRSFMEEGEECMTDEGLKGICKYIFNCFATVKDIKDKKYPKICSFQGDDPIVCCTDCEILTFENNDTRNVVLDNTGGYFLKTGRIAEDKCLEYMLSLPYPCPIRGGRFKDLDPDGGCHGYFYLSYLSAVGGEDAERDEFPHMALLGFGDSLDSAEWLCGGSVISDRFILTAAHCISSKNLGELKYIALGILKRSDPADLWQRHTVKRIIPHPEYQPPSKYHDIALLEVDGRIAFNQHVLPACLDTPNEILAYDTNQIAYATGWGALGRRAGLADTLQNVQLEKFSEEECLTSYPPHRLLKWGYNHTTQVCYGDRRGINDTCEGDSGGPLQVAIPTANCAFKIVGLTSYGRPCGVVGGSGMYTRVQYYTSWIEGVVWK